jgi:N-acetylmuramic acid 6-phosphate etherase
MRPSQMAAVAAVRAALLVMAQAAAGAPGTSGQLIHYGAWASRRVAVPNGAELPATFDWPMARIAFAMSIAGGEHALLTSVERAEDDSDDAVRQMREANVGKTNVVIGVVGSGIFPFTVAALRRASCYGPVTIGMPATQALRCWTWSGSRC